MSDYGTLRLFVGNMYSSKTAHLSLEVTTLREYGRKHIIVCKPSTDTRRGTARIKPRGGRVLKAFEIPVENPGHIFTVIRKEEARTGVRLNVIAIDEVQFFPYDAPPQKRLYNVVAEILRRGYDVIAAGLPLDFRGEPFGATPALIVLARGNVTWLESYCKVCGKRAIFPQRLAGKDRRPVPYNSDIILVGDGEAYEPRCADHFILPGKPVLE